MSKKPIIDFDKIYDKTLKIPCPSCGHDLEYNDNLNFCGKCKANISPLLKKYHTLKYRLEGLVNKFNESQLKLSSLREELKRFQIINEELKSKDRIADSHLKGLKLSEQDIRKKIFQKNNEKNSINDQLKKEKDQKKILSNELNRTIENIKTLTNEVQKLQPYIDELIKKSDSDRENVVLIEQEINRLNTRCNNFESNIGENRVQLKEHKLALDKIVISQNDRLSSNSKLEKDIESLKQNKFAIKAKHEDLASQKSSENLNLCGENLSLEEAKKEEQSLLSTLSQMFELGEGISGKEYRNLSITFENYFIKIDKNLETLKQNSLDIASKIEKQTEQNIVLGKQAHELYATSTRLSWERLNIPLSKLDRLRKFRKYFSFACLLLVVISTLFAYLSAKDSKSFVHMALRTDKYIHEYYYNNWKSDNNHGLDMVYVKGSEFVMNDTLAKVDDFYISKYPITVGQYCEFLNDYKSDFIKNGVFNNIPLIGDICKVDSSGRSSVFASFLTYKGNFDTKAIYDTVVNKWQANDDTYNHIIRVSNVAADAYCKWAGGKLPDAEELYFASKGGSFYDDFNPDSLLVFAKFENLKVIDLQANLLGVYGVHQNIPEHDFFNLTKQDSMRIKNIINDSRKADLFLDRYELILIGNRKQDWNLMYPTFISTSPVDFGGFRRSNGEFFAWYTHCETSSFRLVPKS